MASPNTIRVYALDGSRDFPVEFDYLARRFVVVTLIGADRKELVQGADYDFLTSNMIRLAAGLDLTGYATIEVKRVTSTSERLVVFNDASILTASDLNLSDMQVIHIAEEGRDIASDSLGSDDDGNLDARGRRLVNLADPVNDQDAVTKHYFDTAAAGTGQNAAAAAASAAAALVSQNAAKASETAALGSENTAKDWAIKMDAPVEGTERSAKWHAAQASTSATASATSATASANSAAAALVSQNAAKASETAAASSATASAASATEAAASAASVNPDKLVHQDSATGGALIPSGTTAQRPVPGANHPIRYNETLKQFEGAGDGGEWGGIGGGAQGAVGNKVFWVNDQRITGDFTVKAGQNAGTFGKITINDGVKVVIEDNARWVIV